MRLATGLYVSSRRLGLCGVADMVEFRRDDERGAPVPAFGGGRGWIPFPVEYKRGRKRADKADELQLCAQAVCLEEMLGVSIERGALFYGEPRRRTEVEFMPALRDALETACARARELLDGQSAPVYETGHRCRNCSLAGFCMPEQTGARDRSPSYLEAVYKTLAEDDTEEEP